MASAGKFLARASGFAHTLKRDDIRVNRKNYVALLTVDKPKKLEATRSTTIPSTPARLTRGCPFFVHLLNGLPFDPWVSTKCESDLRA
jgi:hypothetical protein